MAGMNMHAKQFILFFGAILITTVAVRAFAQSAAEQAVLAPIHSMFDGMSKRDAAAIKAPTLPGGTMVLMRDGKPAQMTFESFADRVGKPGKNQIEERIHDPLVRIDNDLAVVWAPFDFLVDGKEFGLHILNVREVIRPPLLTRVPNAPKQLAGVVNLRGSVLPVITLRKPSAEEAHTENATQITPAAIVVVDPGGAVERANPAARRILGVAPSDGSVPWIAPTPLRPPLSEVLHGRADFLPTVWLADEQTRQLRRLVSHRNAVVAERKNVKLRIRALLREERIVSTGRPWTKA